MCGVYIALIVRSGAVTITIIALPCSIAAVVVLTLLIFKIIFSRLSLASRFIIL